MPIEEKTEVEAEEVKAPAKKKATKKKAAKDKAVPAQVDFHEANVKAREAYNAMKRRENAIKK